MNAGAGKLFTDGDRADAAHAVTTGILPDRDIAKLIEGGRISADGGVDPSQIQPASLDLRLGATAWRVRASFLPGKSSTVQAKIDRLKMHQIDLTKPVVLEKGCVYIAELMEELKLPADIAGAANPKSSTGRLDIFTRLITDAECIQHMQCVRRDLQTEADLAELMCLLQQQRKLRQSHSLLY